MRDDVMTSIHRIRFRKNVFLIALAGMMTLPALGYAQAVEALSLQAARTRALASHPEILSAEQAVNAARAGVREARAIRLPSVGLSANYARLSDIPDPTVSVPMPGGVQSIQIAPVILDQYSVKASARAPLFTGFRLQNAEKAASAFASAAQHDFDATREDISFAVENAYWAVFGTRRAVETIRETVRLVEVHRADVERLRDAGLVTQNDVLGVDVRLSEARLRLAIAEHRAELAEATLADLTGLAPGTTISLLDTPSVATRVLPPVDTLHTAALRQRPEIQALDLRMEALNLRADVTRGERYPTVALGAEYAYARPNQRIFPAKDRWDDTWMVGVGVEWTVWNWGATSARVGKAKAEAQRIAEQRRGMIDAIRLGVLNAYLGVVEVDRRLSLADVTVTQARDHEQGLRERFRAGDATSTQVLDAEVALEQAKQTRIQALVDSEIAWARLERAVGGRLR